MGEEHERTAPLQLPVASKRRSFSAGDKAAVLRLLVETKSNKRATARLLQERGGHETVTRSVLRRWERAAAAGRTAQRRTGRPVDAQLRRTCSPT